MNKDQRKKVKEKKNDFEKYFFKSMMEKRWKI